jgi:hypothetical protein
MGLDDIDPEFSTKLCDTKNQCHVERSAIFEQMKRTFSFDRSIAQQASDGISRRA